MYMSHSNDTTGYCGAYCPDACILHLSLVYIVPSPRTLGGDNFGECTTCRENGDPAWTCSAAVSVHADIGGSGNDIMELGRSTGKRKRLYSYVVH